MNPVDTGCSDDTHFNWWLGSSLLLFFSLSPAFPFSFFILFFKDDFKFIPKVADVLTARGERAHKDIKYASNLPGVFQVRLLCASVFCLRITTLDGHSHRKCFSGPIVSPSLKSWQVWRGPRPDAFASKQVTGLAFCFGKGQDLLRAQPRPQPRPVYSPTQLFLGFTPFSFCLLPLQGCIFTHTAMVI